MRARKSIAEKPYIFPIINDSPHLLLQWIKKFFPLNSQMFGEQKKNQAINSTCFRLVNNFCADEWKKFLIFFSFSFIDLSISRSTFTFLLATCHNKIPWITHSKLSLSSQIIIQCLRFIWWILSEGCWRSLKCIYILWLYFELLNVVMVFKRW